MKPLRPATFILSLAALAGAPAAWAANASSDLEVSAGLAPTITVSCTPLRFGVWRVAPRPAGGGVTVISMPYFSDGPFVASGPPGMALALTAAWAPGRGVCTLTGSLAPDDAEMDISLSNAFSALGPDNASSYIGLAAPSNSSGMSYEISPNVAPLVNGATTIYIFGDLTIPEEITTANYGAYKNVDQVTLTINDMQP